MRNIIIVWEKVVQHIQFITLFSKLNIFLQLLFITCSPPFDAGELGKFIQFYVAAAQRRNKGATDRTTACSP